jgi:uncharacterized protein YjbI with pentapeptide repeats
MKLMEQAKAGLARRWRRRGGTWWWAILVIVMPVAVVAAAAVTVLLMFVDSGDPKNQIELIKTGLTVGAGVGGVVALVLTGRRQWATEHDAAERRLTELYAKAVEQLGSDKAAVRHGGLYALERVAQDNPDQRQTVVNVLCAYLRAPFSVPGAPRPRRHHGIRRPLGPQAAVRCQHPASSMLRGSIQVRSVAELDEEMVQEREVRLTAQRIIASHLKSGADGRHLLDTFWADIDLDLTGATLIDFDFGQCRVNETRFGAAKFVGNAEFDGAEFAGNARFGGAEFAGYAEFDSVRFVGYADFERVKFDGQAGFRRAEFVRHAWFGEAEFVESAEFGGVVFSGTALFEKTKFAEDAWLARVKFTEDAGFGEAEFVGNVRFDEAEFVGEAWFDRVKFGSATGFSRSKFVEKAMFSGAVFAGETWFDGVKFASATGFNGTKFVGNARFGQAEFAAGIPTEVSHYLSEVNEGGQLDADAGLV